MGVYNTIAILLLISVGAVLDVFGGRIENKIEEKRSFVYNCTEKLLSRNPCEKITCPQGPRGLPEHLYHQCGKLPHICPQKENDSNAECCREKCVCGDGNRRYSVGDQFRFTVKGQTYTCLCVKDKSGNKVPDCKMSFAVPPKMPKLPPGLPPFPSKKKVVEKK